MSTSYKCVLCGGVCSVCVCGCVVSVLVVCVYVYVYLLNGGMFWSKYPALDVSVRPGT